MESLRKELRDLESGIQKKRNEYAKTMEKAKSDGEKEVVIGKIRQTVERRKAKETGGRGEGKRTVSRKGEVERRTGRRERKEETRGGRKTESFLYSSSER